MLSISLRFALVAVALTGAFFGAAGAYLSPLLGPAAFVCPAGLALLAALAAANTLRENIAGAAKRLEARLKASGFAPADPGEVPVEVKPLVEAFNLAVACAAEMRESLLRLSATDSMTGLFNHREFHRRLGEVISQRRKGGRGLLRP